MKPFSAEGRFECGFNELVAGRVCALTPITADGCIGLGLAVANEPGYYPIPTHWTHAETWDEMAAHAEALNLELFKLDRHQAARIIASTLRRR